MISDLYFFNPTCEPSIANGSPYYTAPARLRKFEADIGYLPAWLGTEFDQVLVQGTVDELFNAKMSKLGFKLPEIISLKQALDDPEWMAQPKGRLCPWGWSPAVYQLFNQVLPSFHDDFQRSAVAMWQGGHKGLYSRLTGINLLGKIVENSDLPWLPGFSDLPVICHTLDEIYYEIKRSIKAVVKTPWSSSGRGLLLFPNPDPKKKNDEVLSGMLNQQDFVTVEPWQKKILDISYQFYSQGGEINYMGRTFFETDQKGRYVRNFLSDSPDLSADISGFLEEHQPTVIHLLRNALSQSKYTSLYEGWIGVDALVYKTGSEELKFHPLIEINGRFTMGAIALKMRQYLDTRSSGFLQIFYSKSSNFEIFSKAQEAEKPLIIKDHKIASGFLPLTPTLNKHSFGAYIEVIDG